MNNRAYINKLLAGTFLSLVLLVTSCKNKPKETIAENEFYVCSMDPQVMEKQMGNCPICKMPLAKTTIDKSQMQLIQLSEEQIKLGNIKTDTLRKDSIWNETTLTGVFTINQNCQQQISSRFNGRIEKLYFKIPGQEIKEGDPVFEVYSRDLMQAEEEYLFALDKGKTLATGSEALLESAKNKLLLWGLTELQIRELEEKKEAKIVNPIYSKVSGTAVEILLKEGDYINEGTTIFKLADLSSLWVEAQVYSNELDLIDRGARLQVIPEAFPEEIIEGEIDFSNPELQPETKINLIRIKVSNKRKQFLPGMMAFVSIKTKATPAFTLPVAAVIQRGKQTHVWVRNENGSFEARAVEIGMQTKGKIEILKGLNEKDVVVTSGSYLLYSDYVFKKGIYPLSTDSAKTGNKSESMENMPGMHM